MQYSLLILYYIKITEMSSTLHILRSAFFMPERGEQMQVTSTVTINTANIRMLTELAKQALVQTAEALHREVQQAQVVPRDKGTLQGEGMFVDDSRINSGIVTIVHSTPYARRWYYNPDLTFVNEYTIRRGRRAGTRVTAHYAHRAVFSHDENPFAKDHWFEDWQPGGKHGDFLPNTFSSKYRRLLRGVR